MLLRRSHARGLTPFLRPAFWLIAIAVTTAIVAKTWMRWMDPQIDFGWQLYVPWRLSLGEHLGRDYVHAYGPLSSYANAALFTVFGVSVQTLVLANLAVYAVVVGLLHHVLRRGFGFFGAAAGTLVGIVVFGFGSHSSISNYTYAAPYCHEATHGMALLLLLLALILRGADQARPSGWAGGLVLGLIALSKVEVVLGAVAVVAAAAWIGLRRGHSPRSVGRWLGETASAAALVLLAAWLLLTAATDARTALRVVSGGFLSPVLYADYTRDAFSLAIMGWDNPTGNLGALLNIGFTCVLYVAGLTAAFRWLAGQRRLGATAVTVIALTLAVVGIGGAYLQQHFIRAGRALPLLMLAAGAIVFLRARREAQRRPAMSARTASQILLWVAAMAMMMRVMLAPKVYHYGFYLTMLAGVWLVAFAVTEWPRLSLPRGLWRTVLGAEIAVTAACVAGFLLADSVAHYGRKSHAVGDAADRIHGFSPDVSLSPAAIEQTRRFLARHTSENSSVLVMPEGIMVNYLTRRKHPLRIADTLPPTLALNSVPLAAALKDAPPDYIVLLSRTADDAYAPFGSDSDPTHHARQWIAANYNVVAHFGGNPLAPFDGTNFGAAILRRSSLAAAAPSPAPVATD